MTLVDMGADEYVGKHPLEADAFTLPETGGEVNFTLDAGEDNHFRWYFVLGSATGRTPGHPMPFDFATLPLNWDFFTDLTIQLVNTPLFENFYGQLGSDGTGTATLWIPDLSHILVPMDLYFAFTLGNPFNFVSEPLMIKIVD
jgi:hypothetical protein